MDQERNDRHPRGIAHRRSLIAVGMTCAVVAAILALAGCGVSGQSSAVPPPPAVAPGPFDMLSGYGDWIEVTPYGQAWRPRVDAGWQPYTDGYWRWTDRGWMWVGYEPFAWVVYHYGSWDFVPGAGWIWVPGDDWAPCRVQWIVSNDEIGWAPLPPPGRPGRELNEVNIWVVVQSQDFASDHIDRYRRRNSALPSDPRAFGIHRGAPDVSFVEQRTNRRIEPVPIVTEPVQTRGRQILRLRPPAGTPAPGAPQPANSATPPPPGTRGDEGKPRVPPPERSGVSTPSPQQTPPPSTGDSPPLHPSTPIRTNNAPGAVRGDDRSGSVAPNAAGKAEKRKAVRQGGKKVEKRNAKPAARKPGAAPADQPGKVKEERRKD